MEPEHRYDRRIHAYGELRAKQQRTADRLSNARLYSIVLGLAASVLTYRTYNWLAGAGIGLLTLILFGYLALRHARVRGQLRHVEALIGVNRKGTERVTGRWTAFPDTGAAFQDADHPYASDLDLFGQASLFQWVNSAHTELGREALARALKRPPEEPSEIRARQEAVTELAGKLAWRQRFEAEGMLVRGKAEPVAPLIRWAEETREAYSQPLARLAFRLLPAVTIVLVTLSVFQRPVPVPWPLPALLVTLQGLLLAVNGKARAEVLQTVYRHEASLSTYAHMLHLFEGQRFSSAWLRVGQQRLRNGAGQSASQQIHALSLLADRISNRENFFFLVLNVLTLWDFQCMAWLEDWKKGSGKLLREWLEVLAEAEALSSLANVRFEHPDWVTPTVVDERSQVPGDSAGLNAERMGHPLITGDRVCNDFALGPDGHIAVVTGSNMSGKSTFLRTVGINLVLAYVGAPVCAQRFRCSVMKLWTSMRTSDNLEQRISSFYAELLRIKRIVEAARTERRVCFLLDEIFKGTNSHDRHQGAKALILQLQRAGAFGLISTHDLELGELARESDGRIKNYHFREEYQGREIRFDYILRPGVSTTRNALYLIKMVGIELQTDG